MDQYLYVLAGNYQQFRDWYKQNLGITAVYKDVRYIPSFKTLKGINPLRANFLLIGTYSERDDFNKIMNEIEMVQAVAENIRTARAKAVSKRNET